MSRLFGWSMVCFAAFQVACAEPFYFTGNFPDDNEPAETEQGEYNDKNADISHFSGKSFSVQMVQNGNEPIKVETEQREYDDEGIVRHSTSRGVIGEDGVYKELSRSDGKRESEDTEDDFKKVPMRKLHSHEKFGEDFRRHVLSDREYFENADKHRSSRGHHKSRFDEYRDDKNFDRKLAADDVNDRRDFGEGYGDENYSRFRNDYRFKKKFDHRNDRRFGHHRKSESPLENAMREKTNGRSRVSFIESIRELYDKVFNEKQSHKADKKFRRSHRNKPRKHESRKNFSGEAEGRFFDRRENPNWDFENRFGKMRETSNSEAFDGNGENFEKEVRRPIRKPGIMIYPKGH